MRLGIHHLLCLLLAGTLPIGIIPPTEDGNQLTIGLTGSTGQYALISRGCDGSILNKKGIPTRAYSISVDQKLKSGERFGIIVSYLRSGVEDFDPVTDEMLKFFTLNPYFNAEAEPIAVGFGLVYMPRGLPRLSGKKVTPSGYLRVGNVQSLYADIRYMHSASALTAGYLQFGMGGRPEGKMGVWFGIGGIPHDRAGFLARFDGRVSRHVWLDVLTRIGFSEGISESGVSLGLRYQP